MKTARITCVIGAAFLLTMCSPLRQQQRNLSKLEKRAKAVKMYAQKKGYSTRYCFLLDMSMQSGLKRFFVYDMSKQNVVYSGMVAHGSCEQPAVKEAKFSNAPGSGCTSVGLYKVGFPYYGQYGKSYKLYGLQKSNCNAFSRAVVLHGYSCVPDKETYPKAICNSLGCPMVSPSFLKKISSLIDKSNKPILLWVYQGSSHAQSIALNS